MTVNVNAYRQIVENADFGILVHANFKILYANGACARLFGYSDPASLLKLDSILLLVDENGRTSLRSQFESLYETPKPHDIPPFTARGKDGSPVRVSATGHSIEWQETTAISHTFTALHDNDLLQKKRLSEEARLFDFEKAITGRFWEMGPDLKFTSLSSKNVKTPDIDAAYYLGKTRDQVIDWEKDETEYLSHAEDLRARRPFYDFTYNRINPDGSTSYIATSGVPFYDADGEFAGYRGVASNLTETQRLKKSHAQLIDALNHVASAIALFDKNGKLVFENEIYSNLLTRSGIPMQETTLERALRFHLGKGEFSDSNVEQERWISDHINHKHPADLVSEILGEDGKWSLLHVQTVKDGSVLVIFSDITEQKKAEEARLVSEAFLKAFVENSPAAVFLKDQDAKFIYVNETYREWQQVTDDDIIGSTIHGLFPPEVAANIAEQDRLALEERKSSNIESITEFPDGVVRSVVAIRFPVINASGDVIGVSGFLMDRSDHYRAQKELDQKTELYTSVLDNLPIGVSVKDLDGRFIIANKQLRIWRPQLKEDYLGQRADDIFNDPAVVSSKRAAQEEETRTSKKIVKREEWRTYEDGSRRFLEWIKFPILDRDGDIVGIGTIGTDLTGRKTVEQHLRTAKETAEIASRAKSEFLAHMSHELRTPLNAVIGFSHIMIEQTFGPLGHANYVDYAKDIYGAGNHLLKVISDILDISKIEAGEIELDQKEIDLGHLMASSIKMIRSRADAAGVIITLKMPRELPAFYGDELRLRQIALNLLSNAVKFTPSGGEITFSIELEPTGALKWEVSDTGIGIPNEDINRVLRPFEQARQGFEFSHEGTGLGLYLTKTLTELHGGTLALTSRVGEGTQVALQFPAERTLL